MTDTLPSRALVDEMDGRINRLGSLLYFHPTTTAYAAAHGVDDVFVLYGAGRAGVMGDVTAEQVVCAFGFLAPTFVAQVWPTVEAFGRPSEIARLYADAMARTAAELWSADEAREVVRLGTQVADSVAPLGLSLFAGWRALQRPDDACAAAALVVHTLRELRGDIHVQSVAVEGLHPLEAEMVTRGDSGAQLHGWPKPWPDPSPFVERVAAAEHRTSERMQRIYSAALSSDELACLATAVENLARA
jgi:hypothetical protein